ncbi:MAG: ABC transporter permease [Phycisphaerae bacterium]|nr:ABC transporter permease [Phycisphaerae bacterium]
MGAYVIRRLVQAVFTIFGVMLVTFLLFRVVAGDIAGAHLGPKATEQQKREWLKKYGYDRPLLINRQPDTRWYDTQFAHYVSTTATFKTRSLINNEKLSDTILERAPYSLAITVPALALGWALAMVVSTLVAYYRASLIDHVGVFLAVLGMCVPYLAFIMGGQWLMFKVAPSMAYGLANPFNIFVPVVISVVAGLGGSVRFYRTVILDETTRDYVRTAQAKGVPLPSVMFKHILKNCMLPILTNLIMAIPFLIMGSLLLELFFGIPGLGDLLLSSITNRDEPIVSGLTFLTALIYVLGTLATDITYVIFDPRVELT